MENNDFGSFIPKAPRQRKNSLTRRQKKLISYFLVGVFSTSLVLGAFSFVVWSYRGEIFQHFAQSYLTELRANAIATNSDIKTESTATQEADIVLENIFIPEKQTPKQPDLVETVKKTSPAVVSIIITKEVPTYEAYVDPNQSINPFGNFFPEFNFNFSVPNYRQNGTEKRQIGGGSGFFVTSDGLIVTNRHVVDQTGVEYTVFMQDGKKYEAEVVDLDKILDIALIRVKGSGFPYLALGDSDKISVGQSVIAIGNALSEFDNTVSMGIISGLSRSLVAGDGSGNTELLDKVIQTDAAINPGNSGGPLLDLNGRVVGVNVAVASGSENIGFALPINSVKGAIDSVKRTGKIVRPHLGIRYLSVNSEVAEQNGLTVDYGVLVKSGADPMDFAVVPGSPASKAGIVENDIILEIDGQKLDQDTSLASIIRSKEVGDRINLRILSKGVSKRISVVLEAAD